MYVTTNVISIKYNAVHIYRLEMVSRGLHGNQLLSNLIHSINFLIILTDTKAGPIYYFIYINYNYVVFVYLFSYCTLLYWSCDISANWDAISNKLPIPVTNQSINQSINHCESIILIIMFLVCAFFFLYLYIIHKIKQFWNQMSMCL